MQFLFFIHLICDALIIVIILLGHVGRSLPFFCRQHILTATRAKATNNIELIFK